MKVVVRALALKFTTAPETKPVPFTVKVKPGPPGAAAAGTKGLLIRGTGLPGLTPVPVRLTDCGLPAALSAIVTAPVRVPAAVGVKVTVMVHPAPALSDEPQVLV